MAKYVDDGAMNGNDFERTLAACPTFHRGPIIDVVDSMDMIRRWCVVYDVPFTAADLIAGAAMILARHDPVE